MRFAFLGPELCLQLHPHVSSRIRSCCSARDSRRQESAVLAHFAARANDVGADIIKSKPHLGEGKLPFAEGKQGVQVLAELGVLSDILAQPGANKYRGIRYQIAGALLRRPTSRRAGTEARSASSSAILRQQGSARTLALRGRASRPRRRRRGAPIRVGRNQSWSRNSSGSRSSKA
jgi:hypothetical protein